MQNHIVVWKVTIKLTVVIVNEVIGDFYFLYAFVGYSTMQIIYFYNQL